MTKQENNQPIDEKKLALFLKQKELLDTFLKSHAITPEQYEKSFNGLVAKMGIPEQYYKESK